MKSTPVGWVDQIWKKGICSSHPQPLLGKVETAGQGCDFHGSSASIPGTPSCVFVMRHILLTKGLLQAHIEGYKTHLLGNSWNIAWGQDTTTCRHIAERDATRRTTKNMGSQTAWPSLPCQEGDWQLWSGRPWTGALHLARPRTGC